MVQNRGSSIFCQICWKWHHTVSFECHQIEYKNMKGIRKALKKYNFIFIQTFLNIFLNFCKIQELLKVLKINWQVKNSQGDWLFLIDSLHPIGFLQTKTKIYQKYLAFKLKIGYQSQVKALLSILAHKKVMQIKASSW